MAIHKIVVAFLQLHLSACTHTHGAIKRPFCRLFSETNPFSSLWNGKWTVVCYYIPMQNVIAVTLLLLLFLLAHTRFVALWNCLLFNCHFTSFKNCIEMQSSFENCAHASCLWFSMAIYPHAHTIFICLFAIIGCCAFVLIQLHVFRVNLFFAKRNRETKKINTFSALFSFCLAPFFFLLFNEN